MFPPLGMWPMIVAGGVTRMGKEIPFLQRLALGCDPDLRSREAGKESEWRREMQERQGIGHVNISFPDTNDILIEWGSTQEETFHHTERARLDRGDTAYKRSIS